MNKGTLVKLNQEYGKAAAYIYKIVDAKIYRNRAMAFISPVRTIARGKEVTSMGVVASLSTWEFTSNLVETN